MTKKPLSPKWTPKQTKSPDGTTIDPKTSDEDSDYVEDTDTDNPFADDKKDITYPTFHFYIAFNTAQVRLP